MAQEVELKFITAQNGVEMLREQLSALEAKHTPAGQLLNIYYEIVDNWLRRHDMELRIRGDQECYEMTLKITGRVVGGPHQRSEYSVLLDRPELALKCLPAETWSQGELPAALTEHIQSLFSTDFARECRVTQEGNSGIEITLGRGEVEVGEHQEPIYELELELLARETADLLRLAHRLLESGVLRQGSLSKAIHGYYLAQDNGERPVTSLTVLMVAAKASVEQGLEVALRSILTYWLYHDEIRLRDNTKARAEILLALARVCHTLMLLDGIMPHKTTTQLRMLLNDAETVLPAADAADEALFRTEVVDVKLTLIEWLVQHGWHPSPDEIGEKKIAGPFKRSADINPSRVAAELRDAMQHLVVGDAANQLPKLSHDIDSVQLLVGAYGDVVTLRLKSWQELHRAIAYNDHSVLEYSRHQALAAEPFWLHSGKQ